jgi:membrane fusion protein, multidrug efflux system
MLDAHDARLSTSVNGLPGIALPVCRLTGAGRAPTLLTGQSVAGILRCCGPRTIPRDLKAFGMFCSSQVRSLAWCTAALLLVACAPKEVQPEPVRAVRTLTVGATTGPANHDYAAEIRPRIESRLGFRVPGKLESRSVNSGDKVHVGEVLARLDATDLRLTQDAARAAQAAAQTNLDQLEADFKRYKDLRDQGFIGAADLERRDSAVKAARAQLDQARAHASAQGNQTGYATLSAPAPGVITAVEAEPGQVLSAGATVVRLALDGPRDAVFSVPEDSVDAIRAVQGKVGAVSMQLWGSAAGLPATVREIAGAADPVTRTFLVKADVGSASVRLGQTATVRMAGAASAPLLRVPLAALVQLQGRTQVWVFDRAAGTVRTQLVAVAGADGNDVAIAQGLKAGDEVVIAGTHALTPGQKARPFVEPSVAPAAAPGASR